MPVGLRRARRSTSRGRPVCYSPRRGGLFPICVQAAAWRSGAYQERIPYIFLSARRALDLDPTIAMRMRHYRLPLRFYGRTVRSSVYVKYSKSGNITGT